MTAAPAWTPSQLARRAVVEAGGTVLANLRRGADEALVAWARERGLFVYIGRAMPRRRLAASPFRNPFRIGRDGDRDAVCDRYAGHLAARPDLLARLGELRGRVLGCWCYPERCHGEALIAALERGAPPPGSIDGSGVGVEQARPAARTTL